MAFDFGSSAWPPGLRAEVNFPNKVVNFSCDDESGSGLRQHLCTVPISSLLLLREQIADEIWPYLVEMPTMATEEGVEDEASN